MAMTRGEFAVARAKAIKEREQIASVAIDKAYDLTGDFKIKQLYNVSVVSQFVDNHNYDTLCELENYIDGGKFYSVGRDVDGSEYQDTIDLSDPNAIKFGSLNRGAVVVTDKRCDVLFSETNNTMDSVGDLTRSTKSAYVYKDKDGNGCKMIYELGTDVISEKDGKFEKKDIVKFQGHSIDMPGKDIYDVTMEDVFAVIDEHQASLNKLTSTISEMGEN